MTGTVGVWSSANLGGRKNGTSAPHSPAITAISSSSVETITLSKDPDAIAAVIAYPIIGFPWNSLMFLRGMRLLPPRAGITANLMGETPLALRLRTLAGSPLGMVTRVPRTRAGLEFPTDEKKNERSFFFLVRIFSGRLIIPLPTQGVNNIRKFTLEVKR